MAVFSAVACQFAFGAETLTRIEDVRRVCDLGGFTNIAYDVTGTLVSYFRRSVTREWIVTISDGTNAFAFMEYNKGGVDAVSEDDPRLNDLVRIQGATYVEDGRQFFGYTRFSLLKRRPTGDEIDISPKEMFDKGLAPRLGRIKGVVRDAFRDESDPQFVTMILNCAGSLVTVMIFDVYYEIADPSEYVGSKVAAEGMVADPKAGARGYAGRILVVSGRQNLHLLKSDASEAAVPDISEIGPMPPSDISLLGRHKAVGTVRAVWHSNRAILETDAHETVMVRFLRPESPTCGQRVCVTGFPETDVYFLSLVNASWSLAEGEPLPDAPPRDVSPAALLRSRLGTPQINIKASGTTVRIRGRLRYLPPSGSRDTRLGVESDGFLVSVEVGSAREMLRELEIGCEVAVTGVCVVETDASSGGAVLPRADGIFIVPRSAGDIEVLSRPPWWTTGRLMALVGMLVAALSAILVWNIALSRRAESRGRELAEERLGHVSSELKVEERTRLAVELHDALSQTLAGVSMEIGAAKEFAGDGEANLSKHLDFAANAIDACRSELKNCIWDLRSEALEAHTMDEAIRKTLAKDIREQQLSLRFAVPRERLSDKTAHAILRAIRELAVNALRHGKASHVYIAGSIEGNVLKFSVRDDGCGFDPTKAQGVSQGHFGLQGIRERIAPSGGRLDIESAPGQGAKATVTYRIPSVHDSAKGNSA